MSTGKKEMMDLPESVIILTTEKDIFGNIIWKDKDKWTPKTKLVIKK